MTTWSCAGDCSVDAIANVPEQIGSPITGISALFIYVCALAALIMAVLTIRALRQRQLDPEKVPLKVPLTYGLVTSTFYALVFFMVS